MISYLSKTVQPNKYVAPFSLDLMAKVNQFKQNKFDENASKIQQSLDSLSSLDVIRDVDRVYLNNKMQSLLNNINSFGGVDLSDNNVSSQIEGMTSSLYQDNNILNAAMSTKKIRSLQTSYDKMKSDSKLMQYYSDANYINDMEEVNRYAQSKDISDSYRGNSSATLYEDYQKDYVNMYKNLIRKGGKYTKISDANGGFFINTENGQRVSSQEIYNEARSILNPKQQAQMERDAYYTYGYRMGLNNNPNGLLELGLQKTTSKINQLKSELDYLTTSKNLEASPEAVQQRYSRIEQIKEELNSSESYLKDKTSFLERMKSNPRAMMYEIYADDFFSAIGNMFQVNEQTLRTQANPFKLKQVEFGYQQQLKNQDFEQAKALQGQKDDAALKRVLLEKGIASVDNNGNITIPNKYSEGGERVDNTHDTDFSIDERKKFSEQQEQQYSNLQNDIDSKINSKFGKDAATQLKEAAYHKGLDGEGSGIIKNIPRGAGDKILESDIYSFGKKVMNAAGQKGEFLSKQYLSFSIDEAKLKDKKSVFDAIKQKIALSNKVPIDDIKLTEMYHSNKGYKKDENNNIIEDNSVYMSYEIKGDKNRKFKQGEIPIQDNQASLINQKFTKTDPNNKIFLLDKLVSQTHPFTTSLQNANNPNFFANVTIVKLDNGMYQSYTTVDGEHSVPMGLPTQSASAALNDAKNTLNSFNNYKKFKESLSTSYKSIDDETNVTFVPQYQLDEHYISPSQKEETIKKEKESSKKINEQREIDYWNNLKGRRIGGGL